MDFFDDDAAGTGAPADSPSASRSRHPERRRPNRRRTRIQRIAILAAIFFVAVFALAWWARSCQQSRKADSYRTYLDGVSVAIADSAALGKQFDQIVANPTKFSRKELIAKLDELSAKQDEITVRAGRLEPPKTLQDGQGVFFTGMKVRASGFELLRATMVSALGKKAVAPQKLTALAGYFSGPDAYYMDLFYTQTRTAMSDDGVSDAAVPTATYYLSWKGLERARIEEMLARVGSSSKLSGIHGVALADVVATTETGDIHLVRGKTADVPASAQLAFAVGVENQGDVAEANVAVAVTLVLPGGASLKQEGTIAGIEPGKTQSVTIQGFAIPSEALSKISTLQVKVGPVPGERVSTNNSGQFKFLLQLK